jgi:hypothetical protein
MRYLLVICRNVKNISSGFTDSHFLLDEFDANSDEHAKEKAKVRVDPKKDERISYIYAVNHKVDLE